MSLFFNMRKWNAQVGTKITQGRDIENITNMGFEVIINMFVENYVGFIKVD